MGHEAIGVVEAVGSEVRAVKVGDLVVMPFAYSDGTCAFCHESLHMACVHGGFLAPASPERRLKPSASRGPMAPWSSCRRAKIPRCYRPC